jgi:YD repeat-containing protein
MQRKRIAIVALLTASLFVSIALAIETPKNARGFKPEELYHFGNIDSVNLFNGNVIVALPIGQHYDVTGKFGYQLMLSHNSTVWDVYSSIYGTHGSCENDQNSFTYIPNQRSNAGAGWSLGYGRLFPACHLSNDVFAAVYESPDGGSHAFTATPDGSLLNGTYTGPVLTDDNSHLRLRNSASGTTGPAYLDFPDGTIYAFTKNACDEWLLESMRDSFGNIVTVTWSANHLTETLADPYGRRTVIHYAVAQENDVYGTVVDSVDLPAFNADPAQADTTVATYHFHYEYPTVPVHFLPGANTCQNAFFVAPVLTSIDLPDSSTFVMTHNPIDIQLLKLTLPTGGSITWNMDNWQIPGDTCKPESFLEGLSARIFHDPFTNKDETWTYESALDSGPFPVGYCPPDFSIPTVILQSPREQKTTTVTSPTGDKTVHYFSVWRGTGGIIPPLPLDHSANGFDPLEFGLAVTHFEPRAGTSLLLSTREYDCKGVPCGSSPDRTTYVQYEQHPYLLPTDHAGDALPKTSRTYFENDTPAGTSYTETAQDDYDGYGHYRKVTSSGNFGPNGAVQSRIVTTNYNGAEAEVGTSSQIKPGSGTWSQGFVPYPAGEPWILGTYTSITREELGAKSKQLFFFNRTDGFLKRVRIRRGTANGSGVYTDVGSDTHDLINTFDETAALVDPGHFDGRLLQAAGDVAAETHYGGDVSPLIGCPSGVCDGQYALETFSLVSGSGKAINRTYTYGTLATETFAGGPFLTINATIDRNTGAPRLFTDPAGHLRTMEYDGMSRILKEVLPSGLVTKYLYTNGSTAAHATASVTSYAPSDLTTPITQATYEYDAFGRVDSLRQLMPDPNSPSGTLTHRDTVWNTLGQKTKEFEPAATGDVGTLTVYTYDAYGRMTSMTPPDGATHATSYTYAGTRAETTTVGAVVQGVAGGIGSDLVSGNVIEHPVSKTAEHDALGRLTKVTESSHNGVATIGSYSYDVLDHLSTVQLTAAEGTQSRTFTFDNRGFLVRESHPENGVTSYDRYDVFGHALHKLQGAADGPFDLTFVYDIYQRLAEVRQGASGLTLVKKMTYDVLPAGDPGAPYAENGQLVKSYRRNYHAELGGDVAVSSYLHYDSTGRLDQKTTSVGSGPSFTQHYAYDVLGDITSLQYPSCSTCTPITGGATIPARTVDFRWSHGYLTGVDQGSTHFTSSTAPIAYWPNGTIKEVTHVAADDSHPAKDSQTLDHGMARPGTITFDGLSSCTTAATVGPGGTVQNGSFDIPITLTGTAPWTLTWADGLVQSGITSSPTIRHVTPGTTTTYTLKSVGDATCTAASSGSATVIVPVCVPVAITAQPTANPTTVTLGGSTTLSVSVSGTSPVIQWYTGSTNVGSGASIPVSPTANTMYFATATNSCSATVTSNTVAVSVCVPATITAQPAANPSTITLGGSTTLSVGVTGTAPVTVQWFNASNVNVGSGTSIAISPASTTTYHATVTNACGTQSANVTVTVCVPVAITAQPTANPSTVTLGNSTTLSIGVTGTSPTIQWFTGSTNAGSGASIPVSPTTNTTYFATVGNSCSTTLTSNTIAVSVCVPAAITTQPAANPSTITLGGNTTLSVGVTGTAPVTVQWFNASNVSVGSGTSISISPASTTTYHATVTNACGTQSANVTVTVCVPVAISSQPTANPSTVTLGNSTTLSIGVTGSSPSIQWFKADNTNAGSGATISVSPTVDTTYHATVGNSCSTTLTSNPVTVSVCFPAAITSQPAATPSTIDPGGSSTLAIAVSGSAPISVQWFAGINLAGSGTSLVVSPADTTVYHAVVTNACGSVTSANARVTVCSPGLGNIFTATPSAIASGQTSKLEVGGATGTATLTYLFYKSDGTFVSSSTTKKLNVSPTVTTSYYYKVSNSCGTTDASTPITVTVQ